MNNIMSIIDETRELVKKWDASGLLNGLKPMDENNPDDKKLLELFNCDCNTKQKIYMNIKVEKLLNGETIISKEPGNSMLPLIKSKQPVKIQPYKWEDTSVGDIVYCKVKGNYYTHLVKAKNDKRGCLIGNNKGGINGWTKNIYGKVIEILES